MEKQGKTQPQLRTRRPSRLSRSCIILAISLFLFSFMLPSRTSFFQNQEHKSNIAKVQKCAIENLKSDLSFLDAASPIEEYEFLDRRDRLARALVASEADAFILEPGYTFQYYGNISQSDWEPWEPEERPFLMLVLPRISGGVISAKTAFLAPYFEEGRVRMLGIPSREPELEIVIWEEHWDPYSTLIESQLFSGLADRKPKIVIDEEMRDFIARGLANAGFQTQGLTPEVELVRQIKSSTEVEVLRAVNTGTVAAVRAMRPCLVAGLTENEVRDILDASLLSIGFSLFFNIVLFEEDGALPHCGFVVGQKKLTHETMVVIDVGAHYLGYSSDICRRFFIDGAAKPKRACLNFLSFFSDKMGLFKQVPHVETELHAEKLRVWKIVLDAQTAAASQFKPNNSAANVDLAARKVIEEAGYGYGFTHRLGHGIGIKGTIFQLEFNHILTTSPYLNKWNTKVALQPGMTFTNEPGIYLEGKFGVRHEDIYLITENGEAELLTGRRAAGPYSP
ncbi:Prolidase/Aminopeptidase P-like protein [Hypoxylon rubiginosum]|uniref:Prolidase/Aminopeptidase P-like protein n=1 Tax=Hypoxylon rubiginosum TaxID=110542 RepID=A0ACC0CN55_9PEZI|nr:Prolidase/Aminopeptidase P-like protein [Hypoxylon rubiginosum]